MVTDYTHDRAQVILIGAIVIAFVLLGVVVVLNGLVYTEEVSSSSTTHSVADAEVSDAELDPVLHRLVTEATDEQPPFEIDEGVIDDIDSYSKSYQNVSANSRSAVNDIDSEIKTDEGITGTFEEEEDFQPNGQMNVEGRVLHFIVHPDLEGETGAVKDLELIDTSDGEETVATIIKDEDNNRISVDTDGDECRVNSDSATVDFVTGDISPQPVIDDCDAEIIDLDSTDSEYRFQSNNNLHSIGYEMVVAGDIDTGNNPDDIEIEYVEITKTYQSNRVQSSRTANITKFGEI